MSDLDDLLDVVDQLHAAGAAAERWPAALQAVAGLIGGVASTLELLDRRKMQYVFFSAAGVPPPEEIAYLMEYGQQNPRVAAALRQKPGELAWDYQILDEAGMDRSPFYERFLKPMGMRYSTAALLEVKPHEFAALAVQRARRHGHVEERELKLMKQLGPRASRALDVTRRLQGLEAVRTNFESALDWLTDGVVAVGAGGEVLHANRAALDLARRGDGMSIGRNGLSFAASAANQALQAALADLAHLAAQKLDSAAADFVAPRGESEPPYVVAVRPAGSAAQALALVFIHDPAADAVDGAQLLRVAFGLTAAEARLAEALRTGTSLEVFAEQHRVSLNTVYTHLRRVKDKTGQHRMVELIRILNAVRSGAARPTRS